MLETQHLPELFAGKSPAQSLLDQWRLAPSAADARVFAERLFSDHVLPYLREATARALGKLGQREQDLPDQAEEVQAEVSLRFHSHLNAVREQNLAPIRDLHAYLDSAVYNACFMRLRARSPRRAQLANRLRFLLRNDSRFAIWDAGNRQLAGLARHRNQAATAIPPRMTFAPADPVIFLERYFELAGGPVAWTELMSAAADLFGVTGSTVVSLEDEGEIAAVRRPAEQQLDNAARLRVLWEEVQALPAGQRVALLLNLRDSDGQGVIEWIPASGLATFAQLAETLGMQPRDLVSVWNALPLDDQAIAQRLGITRQQVINLRKSARARIARRTASDRNQPDGNNPMPAPSTRAGRSLRAAGQTVRRLLGLRGERSDSENSGSNRGSS